MTDTPTTATAPETPSRPSPRGRVRPFAADRLPPDGSSIWVRDRTSSDWHPGVYRAAARRVTVGPPHAPTHVPDRLLTGWRPASRVWHDLVPLTPS